MEYLYTNLLGSVRETIVSISLMSYLVPLMDMMESNNNNKQNKNNEIDDKWKTV